MPIDVFMTTLIDSSLTEIFFDDSSKVGICWLCRTTLSLYLTNPVLLCTTKYYSSTTPYYKVLLQSHSVFQSTTPVPLQYYKVLQSTTPVLVRTTQLYSVLQSTTPVLLRTTKYYSVLQSTTLYYKVLLRTTPYYKVLRQYYSSTTKYYSKTTPYDKVPQNTTSVKLCTTKNYSSTTPYYKVLLQYYSTTVLQSTTPVLLCTTKYCSSTTLYYNHEWSNVIYNARSNWSQLQTSPNAEANSLAGIILITDETLFTLRGTTCCTCRAKSLLWWILMTDETLFTLRGATGVQPQTSRNAAPAAQNHFCDGSWWQVKLESNLKHYEMLHLPRKKTCQNNRDIFRKLLTFIMRDRSENDPFLLGAAWMNPSGTPFSQLEQRCQDCHGRIHQVGCDKNMHKAKFKQQPSTNFQARDAGLW